MTRADHMGFFCYRLLGASSTLPGQFSLPKVFIDDYIVEAFVSGPGCYIKDIRYAELNLLHEPLRANRVDRAQELRLIVGLDGASLGAIVKDAEGKGIPDLNVAAIPADVNSELQVGTLLKRVRTDQNGTCSFGTLAPGECRVLATPDPLDLTPESLRQIMEGTVAATQVELRPGQNQTLSLTPTRSR